MKKPRLHSQTEFDLFFLSLASDRLPPPKQPAPVWKKFCNDAVRRLVRGAGISEERPAMRQVAEEIVSHRDGAAFLKAARRGRGTAKHNLRRALIEEVERLVDVERRRPCANLTEAKPAGFFA